VSANNDERPALVLLRSGRKSANEVMVDAMADYPCAPHPDRLTRGVKMLPHIHTPGAILMYGACTRDGVMIEYAECYTIGEREGAIEHLEEVLRHADPEVSLARMEMA